MQIDIIQAIYTAVCFLFCFSIRMFFLLQILNKNPFLAILSVYIEIEYKCQMLWRNTMTNDQSICDNHVILILCEQGSVAGKF